jgi:Na+-transporting methylmalonyl-CoA/oxaloacetate decarboxylase gamma subunit
MVESGNQIVLIVSVIIFGMGILSLILSVIILARQAMNKDVRTIANATTSLAEKGITEGVSGLVGNASLLIDSLNELAKSNTGIGIFFVFLSLVLFAAGYYFVKPLIGPLP